MEDQNEIMMRECIKLAKESAIAGDPPFRDMQFVFLAYPDVGPGT